MGTDGQNCSEEWEGAEERWSGGGVPAKNAGGSESGDGRGAQRRAGRPTRLQPVLHLRVSRFWG
eukprot:scaffold4238_cov105-Isochrysis_galbana.AAC.9